MDFKEISTFHIELLKSLNYKEEDSGYNHIKYYTKGETTFVIGISTNRIGVWKPGISSEQFISNANFLKRLQDEL